MKKRITVIGEKEEVIGYKLAGIQDILYLQDPSLKEKIQADKSIVFFTQKAKDQLGDFLTELGKKTLVQQIPGSDEKYDRISRIIEDTVGFDLRK